MLYLAPGLTNPTISRLNKIQARFFRRIKNRAKKLKTKDFFMQDWIT